MAAPLPLRMDVTTDDVRRHARRARDGNQARRLLALAAIYEGGSRSDAARIGGVGLQIVRDWVVRFNAAGPDGLIDRKASGPLPRLNEAQRQALAAAVERGPVPAVHGVVSSGGSATGCFAVGSPRGDGRETEAMLPAGSELRSCDLQS